MQETIVRVVMWCDFHGKGTEGVETHTVGLDGKEREVDVCAECSLMLSEPFGRALQVGRKVTGSVHRRPPRGPDARPRARSAPGTHEYNLALKEFCHENNLRNPKNPAVMMYQTTTGRGVWYSAELKRLFAAAQTEKEKEVG